MPIGRYERGLVPDTERVGVRFRRQMERKAAELSVFPDAAKVPIKVSLMSARTSIRGGS